MQLKPGTPDRICMAPEHVQAVNKACKVTIEEQDKLVRGDGPSTLYHLTDTDGFIGIVSSRCLWACLATEMNNALGKRYGCDLTAEVLRERVQKHGRPFDEAALAFLLEPATAAFRSALAASHATLRALEQTCETPSGALRETSGKRAPSGVSQRLDSVTLSVTL
jgi:hypothetical protein